MKLCILTTAAALSSSLAFATLVEGTSVATFEDGSKTGWTYSGSGTDASEVKDYDNDAPSAPISGGLENVGSKYLSVNTAGGVLSYSIGNEAVALPDGGIYLDTMVKMVACEEAPAKTDGDRLNIWIQVDENGEKPKLYARANAVDANGACEEQVFELTPPLAVNPDTWYRLTIKAIKATADIAGFQIYLNNELLFAQADVFNRDYVSGLELDTAAKNKLLSKCVFASLIPNDAKVSAIGAIGQGALDNVAFMTDAIADNMVLVTLTAPAGVTTTYKLGDDGEVVTFTGTEELYIPADTAITLSGTVNGRPAKTVTGTAADGLELTVESNPIAYYLDAIEGTAYFAIASVADLNSLAALVNDGISTVGVTFKQTADIDFTGAAAFPGIGTAGAETSTLASAKAFEGTYDGQNYAIRNIKMTLRKGSGVFNVLRKATVENLVIDTVTYDTFTANKLGGAMLAGITSGGTTIRNVTTTGANSTVDNPIFYNAAGLINRIELWDGSVLIENCTNNAAIYCVYSKVAGICPIIENENRAAGATVTFRNCANTGAINEGIALAKHSVTEKKPGEDGATGILAFTQNAGAVNIENCTSTGTINGGLRASIFAKHSSGTMTVTVSGENKVRDDVVAFGSTVSASSVAFATVEDGVATLGAVPAADGSYKVMAAGGSATVALAAGQTLTIDETLAKATVNVTAADGFNVIASNLDGIYQWSVQLAALGTVEKITEEGDVTGSETPRATVDVHNCTLPWHEKNESIGRMSDGWWVGIKVIAPEGYAGGAKYTSTKSNADAGTFNKSFDANKDGEWYIGLWGKVTEEFIATAKTYSGKIVYNYYFDWNNDGVLDQTVSMVIDADTVTLLPKPVTEIVLAPGASAGESVTVTAASEDAAKDLVKLTAPDGSNVADATYAGYFTKNAVSNGNGGYIVTAVLNNENNALDPDIKSENLLADTLDEIAAGTVESVSVGNAKAGLYYTLQEGETLELAPTCSVLATGDTVSLPVTKKGGVSGFYRILVTPYPVSIPAAE